MKFTDSPFEELMQEIPRYRPEPPQPAPRGTRCHGCPYWRGIRCVSCYRDLLKGGRDDR